MAYQVANVSNPNRKDNTIVFSIFEGKDTCRNSTQDQSKVVIRNRITHPIVFQLLYHMKPHEPVFLIRSLHLPIIVAAKLFQRSFSTVLCASIFNTILTTRSKFSILTFSFKSSYYTIRTSSVHWPFIHKSLHNIVIKRMYFFLQCTRQILMVGNILFYFPPLFISCRSVTINLFL